MNTDLPANLPPLPPVPSLDCSRDELIAFIRTRKPGDRVIEMGESGMKGQIGTVEIHRGEVCIRWDTEFDLPGQMVSSFTAGARMIEAVRDPLGDYPDDTANQDFAMSEGETPLTDANVAKLTKTPDCFCEADFARDLERRANEAEFRADQAEGALALLDKVAKAAGFENSTEAILRGEKAEAKGKRVLARLIKARDFKMDMRAYQEIQEAINELQR